MGKDHGTLGDEDDTVISMFNTNKHYTKPIFVLSNTKYPSVCDNCINRQVIYLSLNGFLYETYNTCTNMAQNNGKTMTLSAKLQCNVVIHE